MFKNILALRIGPHCDLSLQTIETQLQTLPFVECPLSQERSFGFAPPRGEAHGVLAESVGGQYLLRYVSESRAVPASVLARKVKEQAAQIEAQTGRKPGKKEMRDLKEEAKMALLPMAFSKMASTTVWIEPEQRLLVLDTGNQARADDIVTQLVKLLPGFSVTALNTQSSPATAMAEWLSSQQAPAGFGIDKECELKASDDSKAAVRYAKHPLDIDEVRQHIASGKLPTQLALTWDDRVSFVLTDTMLVKKLQFLDVVFDDQNEQDRGFDADAAISTGELRQLIPDLLAALGGEMALA